jgi:hypothetical protein
MPTMEPDTPPNPTPASDSHPSIPVSHPRSSPRSPASTSTSQPPISPPRPSIVTPTATQTTLSCSLVAAVSEAAAPPMSCALSNSPPAVQLDPDALPAVTRADSSEPRVPNVYINGLPPNFPEEQLYALTKDFGGVVSVRTFTRHVSDRPSYVPFNPYLPHLLKSSIFSGYGFVLCVWLTARYSAQLSHTRFIRFDSIESAEKCIEALRRYRNLHPSFCKAGDISLCCVSVVLNAQRFRTFTPFLALAMLLFRLLKPRFRHPHRLRDQTAILSSHEWSDSGTRVAPTCTSKGSPSASMSLYVSL